MLWKKLVTERDEEFDLTTIKLKMKRSHFHPRINRRPWRLQCRYESMVMKSPEHIRFLLARSTANTQLVRAWRRRIAAPINWTFYQGYWRVFCGSSRRAVALCRCGICLSVRRLIMAKTDRGASSGVSGCAADIEENAPDQGGGGTAASASSRRRIAAQMPYDQKPPMASDDGPLMYVEPHRADNLMGRLGRHGARYAARPRVACH